MKVDEKYTLFYGFIYLCLFLPGVSNLDSRAQPPTYHKRRTRQLLNQRKRETSTRREGDCSSGSDPGGAFEKLLRSRSVAAADEEC